MSNLVNVVHLRKEFKRVEGIASVPVLDDVNLTVAPGDKIAILGKSGAGKSTLLHIMGTLQAPTSGNVLFEDKDVFRFREASLSRFRNRVLGFVFQFHYLMLEFNALENVMMPALISGRTRAEVKEYARALLNDVDLSHRETHRPSELSGGEQQRVAIARALMMEPKLLLTDEMTGNLDPTTGKKVFDLVQTLHDKHKMAMVSVTHDTALAKSYPKVYELTDGKLSLL